MDHEQVKRIVEVLIFASDAPLSINRIKNILNETDKEDIEKVIQELNTEYESRSFKIIKVARGYQMVTKPEYHQWVKRLFAPRARPKLSQAALETLAVIAYKQPVSRAEIEAIRGVNCDGVLSTLLERNLITVKGRATTVGRPLLYGTTEEFLRYFGINHLSDLPSLEEIDEILKERERPQDEAE